MFRTCETQASEQRAGAGWRGVAVDLTERFMGERNLLTATSRFGLGNRRFIEGEESPDSIG